MKRVKLSMVSSDECQGIQICGTNHCKKISCKWQGISACKGKNIIKTGYNSLGFKITPEGVEMHQHN